MPTPLGHALGGLAAGWLVCRSMLPGWHATIFWPWSRADPHDPAVRIHPSSNLSTVALSGVLYGVVGIAPDLDLLVGAHSTYTHSVGAVGLVFVAALAASKRPRVAAAIAAAWASHLLLDWLGSDTSPPIGIMALWPFSREHYQSSFYIFEAISRRYWLPEQFVWWNLKAALKEVLILGPLAGVSYWITYANHRVTKNTENAQSSS
jgi:membrane-bound metal-dependent hydrolase YbcI (DUF457 family)